MKPTRRTLLTIPLAAPALAAGSAVADVGALGRWLRTWIQPDGAIHGFHNHSVWGDNPFRYGDFTCGHSTFASPLLAALARAWSLRPDPRAQSLLHTLAGFQVRAVQADGQFAHIGFQVGETLKRGLIHNVVPCVALCEAARLAGDALGAELRSAIDRRVRAVLETCGRLYGERVNRGVANQEYCRLWARLAHMQAFGHREWDGQVRDGLAQLAQDFLVAGVPDPESAGVLRTAADRELIEPAEYYGLMIHPLVLAYERDRDTAWLEQAARLARHVIRSAWIDARQCRRVHRLWSFLQGEWRRADEPMLIGGIGITLSSIAALDRVRPDPEFRRFLDEMDRTYARYQTPGGFFLAASGWHAEPDLIPSSAWQSHDFDHLIAQHGAPAGFWDAFFAPHPGAVAVFGDSMIWVETADHWSLRGYETAHGLELVGRKDRARFAVDIPTWIRDARHAPRELLMPDEPRFARARDGIYQTRGRRDVRAFSTLPVNVHLLDPSRRAPA